MRFISFDNQPQCFTKTTNPMVLSFQKQTSRMTNQTYSSTTNQFLSDYPDSGKVKENLMNKLNLGVIRMEKQEQRKLGKQYYKEITPSSIDLLAQAHHQKSRTNNFLNLGMQKGRDNLLYQQTDLYNNIQLENTKGVREQEIIQKKQERSYRVKMTVNHNPHRRQFPDVINPSSSN